MIIGINVISTTTTTDFRIDDSYDNAYKRPIQYSAGSGFKQNSLSNKDNSTRPMTKGEIKKMFTPIKKTRRPCTRPQNL